MNESRFPSTANLPETAFGFARELSSNEKAFVDFRSGLLLKPTETNASPSTPTAPGSGLIETGHMVGQVWWRVASAPTLPSIEVIVTSWARSDEVIVAV